MTRATAVLMRLRKRPVAESDDDHGIDGEWIPLSKRPALKPDLTQLVPLIMSIHDLVAHGYPLLPDMIPVQEKDAKDTQEASIEVEESVAPNDLTSVSVSAIAADAEDTEISKESSVSSLAKRRRILRSCDRCYEDFEPAYPLTLKTKDACLYHHGRLRSTVIDGNLVICFGAKCSLKNRK
jgi:hypothetical protein